VRGPASAGQTQRIGQEAWLAVAAYAEFHATVNLVLKLLRRHLLDLLQQGGEDQLGIVLLIARINWGGSGVGEDIDPDDIRVVDDDTPAAEFAGDAMGHRQCIVAEGGACVVA